MTNLTEELNTALIVIKMSLHELETKVAIAERLLKQKYPALHSEYEKDVGKAVGGPLSANAKILEDIQHKVKARQ